MLTWVGKREMDSADITPSRHSGMAGKAGACVLGPAMEVNSASSTLDQP